MSDMKNLMENWRKFSDLERDPAKHEFSDEENRLIKEHNLTDEQLQKLIDEGKIGDWFKKKGRQAKGAWEIGSGKGQATNIAGERVLDIDKRNELKDQGLESIKKDLLVVKFDPLIELFTALRKCDWPNFRKGRAVCNLPGGICADPDKPGPDKPGPGKKRPGRKKTDTDHDRDPIGTFRTGTTNAPGVIGGRSGTSGAQVRKPQRAQTWDQASKSKADQVAEGGGFLKHSKEFDSGVDICNVVYECIKKEYEDSEKTDEDLEKGNQRIAVLRALVIYYQDYVLEDRGVHMTEEQELDEAPFPKGPRGEGPTELGDIPDEEPPTEPTEVGSGEAPAEEESTIGAPYGQTSKNYDAVFSYEMPAKLAMLAAAAIAAGYVTDSDWFKSLFSGPPPDPGADPNQLVANAAKTFTIPDGGGITQGLELVVPQSIPLDASAPLSNLATPEVAQWTPAIEEALNKPGGPAAWAAVMEMANDPQQAAGKTLGDVLKGTWSGTGESIGDMLTVDQGAFQNGLAQKLAGGMAKVGKMGGIAAIKAFVMKYLGVSLGMLGVSMGVGAAATLAGRKKGQWKSKMASLQKMVLSYKDLEPGEKEEDKDCEKIEADYREEYAEESGHMAPEDFESEVKAFLLKNDCGEEDDPVKECPKGQYWNPDQKRCLDIPKCKPGQRWDPKKLKCVKKRRTPVKKPKGEPIYFYDAGPHRDGQTNQSLQSMLTPLANGPKQNWAVKAALGALQQDLEKKGFTIKENLLEISAKARKELQQGQHEAPGADEDPQDPSDDQQMKDDQEYLDDLGLGINDGAAEEQIPTRAKGFFKKIRKLADEANRAFPRGILDMLQKLERDVGDVPMASTGPHKNETLSSQIKHLEGIIKELEEIVHRATIGDSSLPETKKNLKLLDDTIQKKLEKWAIAKITKKAADNFITKRFPKGIIPQHEVPGAKENKFIIDMQSARRVLENPPEGEDPLSQAQIRSFMLSIKKYLALYAKDFRFQLRESKKEVKKELISESLRDRWKSLSGIR